jgi:hypothetical protein
MILSLLSMLGGGLLRLLPELLGFLNKKTDNAHELAMLDKQFQLEQFRSSAHMQEIQVQGDISTAMAMLDAQKEALKGQMQIVGIGWVDALNFLVRPLTTYYMLILYGTAKAALFIVAVQANHDIWNSVLQIYTESDRAMLYGILSFWYTGRVFDKKAN